MNKQLFTFGLVLSIATTACAGLGIQTSPTLASEFFQEQGFGPLWGEGTDETTDTAICVEHRNDRELADLWMEANRNTSWNGNGTKEAPRADAILEKLMLTHSVFASDSDRSRAQPKSDDSCKPEG